MSVLLSFSRSKSLTWNAIGEALPQWHGTMLNLVLRLSITTSTLLHYQHNCTFDSSRRLEFPESLLQHLPSNQQVRVIILVSEPTEEDEAVWRRLAAEQFFTDYSDADAIY